MTAPQGLRFAGLFSKRLRGPAALLTSDCGVACVGLLGCDGRLAVAGILRPSRCVMLLDEARLSEIRETLDRQLWKRGLLCSETAGKSAVVVLKPQVKHLQVSVGLHWRTTAAGCASSQNTTQQCSRLFSGIQSGLQNKKTNSQHAGLATHLETSDEYGCENGF